MSLTPRTLYPTFAVALLSFFVSQLVACAELVSINSITNNAKTIGVFFDPPVTLPSATNPANYTVFAKTGAVSVASVSLQTNGQFVALNLAANIGEFFMVNVSNVVDVLANTNNAGVLGYISAYGSADIGIGGNPSPTGQVYTAHGDTFEVTVGGSDVGGTNDFFHFIYQQVVSNFDMSVMVTRLDQADDESKAGLMARENLTPGSRTLQTFFTPTGGSNDVQVAVRATPGGTTTDSGFQIGARALASDNNWLRLTRTNNLFTAYHGTNGVDWTISGSTTQFFASTLSIGLMTTAHTTNGTATTAGFTDFGKVGARPGDGVLPTLNASLSGTNLALSWLRTPRDFTVEISTNLTNWALLLAPILEGATNTNQRLMNVPLNLSSNQLFFRLVRVDRVIPDPAYWLSTGITLSLANLNTTKSAANLLCSVTVRDAITQQSLAAVPGYLVTFTTATDDTANTLDTVLQVRKGNILSNVPCNDDFAGIKSQMIYDTNPTSNTPSTYSTFGMVAAVKPSTPTTQSMQIKVSIIMTPQ